MNENQTNTVYANTSMCLYVCMYVCMYVCYVCVYVYLYYIHDMYVHACVCEYSYYATGAEDSDPVTEQWSHSCSGHRTC